MLAVFLATFAVTFLAELPDKTALAAVLLSARGRPREVFLGAAAAFLVHTALAVAVGGALSLLPGRLVRLGAGAVFLVLGLAAWLRRDAEEAAELALKGRSRAFGEAFVVIFLAEWGDLTQFSTAALAARYARPFVVFSGALLALWAAAGLAVFLGARLKDSLRTAALQRLAAAVFAGVGLLLLAGAVRA